MQIIKHRETAFLLYFGLLMILVGTSMYVEFNVVNMIYFIVVVCCFLKYVLIVNKNVE